MVTKYIVDNLKEQIINGDITINGNLNVNTPNSSGTYRALLTQTGSLNGDGFYFNHELIIGETYEIVNYKEYDDFSNVADVQIGIVDYEYRWDVPRQLDQQFYGVTGSTDGTGVDASFDVTIDSVSGSSSISILNIGRDYELRDTITILGTDVGGRTPQNDIIITVTELSPSINSTGCVFIATGDTPIIWGNSELTSVGNLIVDVLENTLGDELIWLYEPFFQEGLYIAVFSEYLNNNNLCKKFIKNKTQITAPSLITPYYDFIIPTSPLILTSFVGSLFGESIGDSILLSVYDTIGGNFSGDSLYYTPIEIKLNSNTTQEEEPITSINWGLFGGDSDFDSYGIQFEPILNVSRMTTSCGYATAHVHSDYKLTHLTIDLYDNSIRDWKNVWTYTIKNQNYNVSDSPDFNFPDNIDVTFTNITSVGGIRVTSDPGQDQTYHDFGTLRFNFFN